MKSKKIIVNRSFYLTRRAEEFSAQSYEMIVPIYQRKHIRAGKIQINIHSSLVNPNLDKEDEYAENTI